VTGENLKWNFGKCKKVNVSGIILHDISGI